MINQVKTGSLFISPPKIAANTLTRSDYRHYTNRFDSFYGTTAKIGHLMIKHFEVLCLMCVCGQYCVAYLLFRCIGLSMKNFVKTFGTDLIVNDRRVFDWFKGNQKGNIKCYARERANTKQPF